MFAGTFQQNENATVHVNISREWWATIDDRSTKYSDNDDNDDDDDDESNKSISLRL